jgi:tungstate transport system permease protein
MDLVTEAFGDAARLIVGRDPELLRIAALSLAVSGLAAVLAGLLGVPLGAALHLMRWPGRRPLVLAVNTGMGLPPVVVRPRGPTAAVARPPLGSLRLLYAAGHGDGAVDRGALPIVAGFVRGAEPAGP